MLRKFAAFPLGRHRPLRLTPKNLPIDAARRFVSIYTPTELKEIQIQQAHSARVTTLEDARAKATYHPPPPPRYPFENLYGISAVNEELGERDF
jgi:hypothetical protein